MSGYIADGNPTRQTYNGVLYSIQKYQGEHSNEFTIMEIDENGIENGIAQLYKRGILQMDWRMKNGKRIGRLTKYNNGMVDRVLFWNHIEESINTGILRSIINDVSGKELMEETVIGTGIVIYRGEYSGSRYERSGFGIEYDEMTGKEKRCGYYVNGELRHLHQEFEYINDGNGGRMQMIEYDGRKYEDNVSQDFTCIPVYIGEYMFDTKQFQFIRKGKGYKLDKDSGVCEWTGEWNAKGEAIHGSKTELHFGWYRDDQLRTDNSRFLIDCIRMTQEVMICEEIKYSIPRGIEDFDIKDHSTYRYESDYGGYLNFHSFPRLKSMAIGVGNYTGYSSFYVDDMPLLESIIIRNASFGRVFNVSGRGYFHIMNCPKLLKLEIGANTFSRWEVFTLKSLNSLKSIVIGENCFQPADLLLKGM